MPRQKGLSEDEIYRLLFEEIPSEEDSVIDSDDSSSDPTYINKNLNKEKVFNTVSSSSESEQSDSDVPNVSKVLSRTASSSFAVTWTQDTRVLPVPPFTKESGVAARIKNKANIKPLDLFCEYFDETLINHIVFQTNLYATQTGKQFVPTDACEIRTFIGINLYMGITKKPSYRDYWSSEPDLGENYISKLMTVKRFSFLLSHLHLNDNTVAPDRNSVSYDKLYKLRPLLDHLSKKFFECYQPHQKLAVDESMVKFKGRSSLKQYMRDKPIKRGYKSWMLCDESSYNLKFDIYTGKTLGATEVGLGAKVVQNLLSGLEGCHHIVFMDNYFSSYDLFSNLKSKSEIYACGTINPRRKHLPALKDEKQLERGEFDCRVSEDGVAVYRWKDNKAVNLISTCHDPLDVSSVNRKMKDGTVTTIKCPQVLKDYNSHMNFVDNFDRLKSDYAINRKSKKWWMRLFFHFIDCCVTNAFIMHKELPVEQFTNKDFRREVYKGLLAPRIVAVIASTPSGSKGMSPVAIKTHKPFVDKSIRHESSGHQPVHSTSRRCAVCSSRKKPVRTVWMCTVCKVPLCLRAGKECFRSYHSK
ncbi:piggyBac transposable element-derived protein 4-like [Bacillus rossius redtenbacheri]|uniref:piggyBac transposable element-derived protein 4-like n=1 Tax=Bacillus rossius redtenbacheri TaxID=93214 RepID=UPI002FDE9F9E